MIDTIYITCIFQERKRRTSESGSDSGPTPSRKKARSNNTSDNLSDTSVLTNHTSPRKSGLVSRILDQPATIQRPVMHTWLQLCSIGADLTIRNSKSWQNIDNSLIVFFLTRTLHHLMLREWLKLWKKRTFNRPRSSLASLVWALWARVWSRTSSIRVIKLSSGIAQQKRYDFFFLIQ